MLDAVANEIDQLHEELAGSEEEIMFLEAKSKTADKALDKIIEWTYLDNAAENCRKIAEKALEEMGN